MFKRTCAAVREHKREIYYNATNLNRKRRINLIKEFKNNLKGEDVDFVATVIAVPYHVCLKRNASRDRVVPENVIERMYRQFNVPSTAEGFSYVVAMHNYNMWNEDERTKIIYRVHDFDNVSQDNPHHTLSVGEHCYAAYEFIVNHQTDILEELGLKWFYIIKTATKCHDIGKPFCKTFKNAKGEETDIAHFYNHENVGAYEFLADSIHMDNMMTALLINLHMIFYMDAKYQEKMKAMYGEEIWKALEWLHRADQTTH